MTIAIDENAFTITETYSVANRGSCPTLQFATAAVNYVFLKLIIIFIYVRPRHIVLMTKIFYG